MSVSYFQVFIHSFVYKGKEIETHERAKFRDASEALLCIAFLISPLDHTSSKA